MNKKEASGEREEEEVLHLRQREEKQRAKYIAARSEEEKGAEKKGLPKKENISRPLARGSEI